jgi:hypothetical protein
VLWLVPLLEATECHCHSSLIFEMALDAHHRYANDEFLCS